MVQYSDPRDVADKAAGWTQAQVDCRLYRHDWTRRMTAVHKVRGGGYQVRQTCERGCGVSRSTIIDRRGYQVEPWAMDYRDAKGYLMTDDDGKPLGRVSIDGRAAIWLQALATMAVREAGDE